jgi:hypothetical protein
MRLKLVSPSHDTLLGHIDVPDHWQNWLERNGAASTLVSPRLPRFIEDAEIAYPVMVNQITIARAYHSEYRDAVCLIRGSIEELEKLPGCSFSPSMAYLRSQARHE